MQVLRDYQVAAENEAREAIRSGHRRVLIVAPTGSGKTTIAASIIHQARSKGSKIIFIAHRKELIDQCSQRLDGTGINHGIIMANHPRHNPSLPVQVASVQTLIRRDLPWRPDILFIDEAHRSRGESYLDIIYACEDPVVIGLTATPCRADGRGLGGELFQSIVECPPIKELVNKGYLVPPVMYSCAKPDLKGIKKTAGDYNLEQLEAAVNKPGLIGDIVVEWSKHAANRPTVVFAVSVDHSIAIRDQFRRFNILAEHIDGTTPKPEREAVLANLAAGRIQVLCNCAVLTEGWDSPIVSACIIARPTLSLGLYLQMAGRVLRTYSGKENCIILDHGGCYANHGHVLASRDWSLTTDRKKRKAEALSSQDEFLVCPECHAVCDLGTIQCSCGYVFSKRKSVIHKPGSLSLVTDDDGVPDVSEDRRRSQYFWWLLQQHTRFKMDGDPYSTGYAFAKYLNQFKQRPQRGWKAQWESQNQEIVAADKARRSQIQAQSSNPLTLEHS